MQEARESLKRSLNKQALKIYSVPGFVLSLEYVKMDEAEALYQGRSVLQTSREQSLACHSPRQSPDCLCQLGDHKQVTFTLQSPVSSPLAVENLHPLIRWLYV